MFAGRWLTLYLIKFSMLFVKYHKYHVITLYLSSVGINFTAFLLTSKSVWQIRLWSQILLMLLSHYGWSGQKKKRENHHWKLSLLCKILFFIYLEGFYKMIFREYFAVFHFNTFLYKWPFKFYDITYLIRKFTYLRCATNDSSLLNEIFEGYF